MLMDHTVPIDIDDFSDDFTHCFTGECRVNVLPILFQISQIITESEDLATSLAVMLKVMQERLKIVARHGDALRPAIRDDFHP